MKNFIKKFCITLSATILIFYQLSFPVKSTPCYVLFGKEIVETAKQYIGIPYRFGGASPETGFDCSGFVLYIFNQYNIKLPHRADLQYNYGENISKDELREGDIVFFRSLSGSYIGHVGIYVGDGNFIHAPHTGDRVKIDSLESRMNRYVGAKRIVSNQYL